MNVTTTQMYWLIKLDEIRNHIEGLLHLPVLIIIFGLIGFICLTIIYFFAGNGNYDLFSGKSNEEFENIRKILWRWRGICIKSVIISGMISIAISLAGCLIPSTKQMAAVLIVPKIANSEKVQTIGNKVYDLAVEWMEELKPNKKEGEK